MGASIHGVIAFALLAGFLVVGGYLRSRIGWLRATLVPGSIVGGVIGFGLISMGWIPGFKAGDFTSLAFNFFTLSFMALCLTGSPKKAPGEKGDGIVKGGLWLTLMWTASLGVQGVLGYLVITGYDAFTHGGISPMLGAIATHGFTQGPGQALTMGTIWEKNYGIANAAQIGMIYASIGFLVAFVVGVPVARRILKRGLNANRASKLDTEFMSGFYNSDTPLRDSRPVTHSANLDSLAWHLGLLAVAYVITYAWLTVMQPVVAHNPILHVLFSYNLFFAHGLIVCVLMRVVIDKMGWADRVDDDTMKHITGSSVDFMVAGTIMSIQVAVLYALLVPILLVCVVITAVTLIGALWVGKMSGRLGPERALTAFGCCCGSTGTGMLLLRMVDADFSTSVPKELAFFNIAIIAVNIPTLFIAAPIAPSLGMWGYIGAFGGYALLALACIPLLRGWQRSRSVRNEAVVL